MYQNYNSVEKLTQLREARNPKSKPLSIVEQLDLESQCRQLAAEDAKRRQEEAAQKQAVQPLRSTDEAIARLIELRQQQGAKPSKAWKRW